MKKKLMAMLLVVAMTLSMVACGSKEEEPAEAPAEEAAPAEEVAEEAVVEEKPLEKMLKAELIEYAEANGIEIDAKATKAVIIEAIKAAK